MDSLVKTFAELEGAEPVLPEDLLATLRDYAESGAAISDRVVVGIVCRTQMTRAQLENLLGSANTGVEVHRRMLEEKEADKYLAVAQRVRELLQGLQQ